MIRQVSAFQEESVAIVSVCGFDICHIQRLQDQPYLSQSLVMGYYVSIRDSSVNCRGWEREKKTNTTSY